MRKEVKIGLTGVAALMILFFGIKFLKGANLFSSSSTYYIRFSNAKGLSKNSTVFADGYNVGTVSDIIYALIVGLGMGFIMEPLQNPKYQFFLQISGSVILLLFGLFCFRSNPAKKMHHHTKNKGKGSLFNNGLTAFLVTFSNPLIIFLFMATFAQFAFVQPSRPFETCVGFACIPLGALLWWYGLTWLVDKIGGRFNVTGIAIINKVIGSVVILFSVIILFGTVFNLYHLPSY